MVELFAKGRGVELFLEGAMEAFADPVGLRMASFGAGVIDILYRQVPVSPGLKQPQFPRF
jgi:hypothetical protein